MSDSQNTRKFATPSITMLPGRLTKDPEIVTLDAKGDLPSKTLLKVTVVDSAGSDYYKDVFVTATFDVTKQPKHVLKKLRKGDWLELRGKIEYRTYEGNEGTRVAGDMRYPKDFVLAPGEWSTRGLIDEDDTKGVSAGGKQEELPW